MLTTLGQLRLARSAEAIEFCGAVAQVSAGPATVSPTQEVGGIAAGNPHLADALRSASLHVDVATWVAVTRPTEPGTTGRAARGVFDVFLFRTVFRDKRSWRLDAVRVGRACLKGVRIRKNSGGPFQASIRTRVDSPKREVAG
jgi:hypothetical protein